MTQRLLPFSKRIRPVRVLWGGGRGRHRGRETGEARGGETQETGAASPVCDLETCREGSSGDVESRVLHAVPPIWLPGRNPLGRVSYANMGWAQQHKESGQVWPKESIISRACKWITQNIPYAPTKEAMERMIKVCIEIHSSLP